MYRHLHDIGYEPLWPGLWVPAYQRLCHEVRCRAAVAAIGGDVLVTAQSALHALAILRTEPKKVELLVSSERWLAPREGVCVHYTSGLAAVRSVGKDGLRLTVAPRTFREYARDATVTQRCTAMEPVLRRGDRRAGPSGTHPHSG